MKTIRIGSFWLLALILCITVTPLKAGSTSIQHNKLIFTEGNGFQDNMPDASTVDEVPESITFNKYYEYLKLKKIENIYQEKLKEIQNKANQAYDSWHKFEINFKKLKSQGFENKFQKTAFYYKRKILRMEYKSILNTLSVLIINMKNTTYI